MKPLTRPWLRAMLTLLLLFSASALTGCGPKSPTVIPDDRVLIDLKDGADPMPGWYGISSGYLREIYRKCGEPDK